MTPGDLNATVMLDIQPTKGSSVGFYFLEMQNSFAHQAAVTLTSARRGGRSAARTRIASTLMAATIVSVKWDLGEIHVRFYLGMNSCFGLPSDDECKDLDECQLFQSGSVNLDYRHPTFRNLPGDTWKESSYSPQPCSAEESCINLVYKDGVGFKCVPTDQTYAAVAIGGYKNAKAEVDVLKADLKRCDGIIPEWRTKGTYMHVVIFCLKYFAIKKSRKIHCLNQCFQLKYPSGCHATQISPCLRWLYFRGQLV